jgi:hypothetical protein
MMCLFSQVTDFLLFMGKLMITAGMCALAFWVLTEDVHTVEYVPVLNYTIVPILIIGFGTYFIASIFFGVYSMAVDTIFLCFCKFYFYFIGMLLFLLFSNATTRPSWTWWSPSWLWLNCNQLLRLGHNEARLRCPDGVDGDI